MYAHSESVDITPFIGCADADHADMCGEQRREKPHPRDEDGEGLVIAKEDVGFFGRRVQSGAECAISPGLWLNGFVGWRGGVGVEDGLSEIVHQRRVGLLERRR